MALDEKVDNLLEEGVESVRNFAKQPSIAKTHWNTLRWLINPFTSEIKALTYFLAVMGAVAVYSLSPGFPPRPARIYQSTHHLEKTVELVQNEIGIDLRTVPGVGRAFRNADWDYIFPAGMAMVRYFSEPENNPFHARKREKGYGGKGILLNETDVGIPRDTLDTLSPSALDKLADQRAAVIREAVQDIQDERERNAYFLAAFFTSIDDVRLAVEKAGICAHRLRAGLKSDHSSQSFGPMKARTWYAGSFGIFQRETEQGTYITEDDEFYPLLFDEGYLREVFQKEAKRLHDSGLDRIERKPFMKYFYNRRTCMHFDRAVRGQYERPLAMEKEESLAHYEQRKLGRCLDFDFSKPRSELPELVKELSGHTAVDFVREVRDDLRGTWWGSHLDDFTQYALLAYEQRQK